MDEKNKLSEEVHKQFNEDCALYYNLWAECGNPGFVMENKTDSDIFVLISIYTTEWLMIILPTGK